ncbi:zeta toxin family protein (plasmid) [Bacillus cereus]|uniref:zeta toxin family protein n=1 Tax=Bacillus cereus group TaxID=86661 RepID=UPI000BF42AA4|nr:MULTISPECIES: zeta toxin family protein [Bacillus cereus group]MCU7756781.1 zeta toxin family protein [Bacillus cereus]MDC7752422.1 zeta toxin family protein [Bacillus cereus]PFH82817.1 Zeta toxin [Bacillus cereus]QEL82735.1 Zeta toxin [Bacillus sp. JAS24-2]UXP17264.1 zeta toxin family protein [Bacillus cereus]
MKTTREKYVINGEYTIERKLLHNEIIESFLKGQLQQEQEPEAILLGGGSAAGKSSIGELVSKGYKLQKQNMIWIDPDKIKEKIPEYQGSMESEDIESMKQAAFLVHDESSDITMKLLKICMKRKLNFMYDGTMKNEVKYKKLIQQLRQAGFSIKAIIVDVPIKVALERSNMRFKVTGRLVPEHIIEESHMKVATTFSKIKDLIDCYTLYDNTGKEPEVFAFKESKRVEEIIVDESRNDQFYEKSVLVF